jgi:hypothetical protein
MRSRVMIIFKGELPLDHEVSIQRLIDGWAKDLEKHWSWCGSSLDSCYETAWYELEEECNNEGIEMEHVL